MATGLNELRDEALRIATDKGFTEASVGEDVALIHSEASELLEDHRDGASPKRVWYEERVSAFDGKGNAILIDGKHAFVAIRHEEQRTDGGPLYKPCGIPSEVADIIVRCLHFAGKHEIDVAWAVREKLWYNEQRPKKHGGKAL